jgi:head-tail adaptor
MDFCDPGQLTQPVTIESQPAGGTDSFTARTWSTVATVWASVKPARSSEPVAADRLQQMLTHTVLVRWLPALAVPLDSAQWRVRFNDRRSGQAHVLDIIGPGRDVSHKGRWIVFDCMEGGADGN